MHNKLITLRVHDNKLCADYVKKVYNNMNI